MDFGMNTANELLDVTRNGAAAMDAVVGTIQRLKHIFEAAKSPPVNEVRSAMDNLVDQIMKAREENIQLRKRAIELGERVIELESREEKFAGYRLWETPMSCILLRSGNGVKPVHYLCPNCHDAGIKTILQGDEFSKQCTALPGHGWFHLKQSPPKPGRGMAPHGGGSR